MKPLIIISIFACIGGSTPAVSATCPPPPDHSVEFAYLVDQVRAAPDADTARLATDKMWELWLDAPDALAQQLLDDGLLARSHNRLAVSLRAFERLVAYCPDYAEGYNQRAFIYFIRGDYARALDDLDQAIALDPTHIAAIAGRGLTLLGLGREDEGLEELRYAMTLNPWLPERKFLPEYDGDPL